MRQSPRQGFRLAEQTLRYGADREKTVPLRKSGPPYEADTVALRARATRGKKLRVRGQRQMMRPRPQCGQRLHKPGVGDKKFRTLPEPVFLPREQMKGIVHAPDSERCSRRFQQGLNFPVGIQTMKIDAQKKPGRTIPEKLAHPAGAHLRR